ncbi:MAG TPA: hypothetical protein VG992_01565 [Candidatus Saccharimonadales bacterium]|nr:hypothetical protein [Candidatus Saccharimonadales bacterium]
MANHLSLVVNRITRDQCNPENPYIYYERGGHARAVQLVRERFPDDVQAMILGSLAIDDIMFPTVGREDKALPIPAGLNGESLEDWLMEQAVQAVTEAPEYHRG